MTPTDKPIACSLDGTSYQQRVGEIRALWARALRSSRLEGRQLHLTFDAAARGAVEDMVHNERACCAFLDFRTEMCGDVIAVTITAPADAGDDLLAAFAAAPTADSCGCSV